MFLVPHTRVAGLSSLSAVSTRITGKFNVYPDYKPQDLHLKYRLGTTTRPTSMGGLVTCTPIIARYNSTAATVPIITPSSYRKVSTMPEKLKAIVFLSSVRVGPSFMGEGSWGDRVGKAIRKTLADSDFEVSVWDPKADDYEILKQALHLVQDTSIFPQWMHAKKAELENADAFLICCAEYNSSLPPALVNMMDHFPPAAYKHRPVALITYSVSNMGGVRVQPALKTFATELGMLPIPTIGRVSTVQDKFSDDGSVNDESLQQIMVDQAKELRWYANAIKTYKSATPVPTTKTEY